MAKRSGFYKHEKRQKELKKQKKKQEKLARKHRRVAGDDVDQEVDGERGDSSPPDEWSPGEI